MIPSEVLTLNYKALKLGENSALTYKNREPSRSRRQSTPRSWMRESLRRSQRFKAKSQGATTFNAEEDLPAKERNRKSVADRWGRKLSIRGAKGRKLCPVRQRGQVGRGLQNTDWVDPHEEKQ